MYLFLQDNFQYQIVKWKLRLLRTNSSVWLYLITAYTHACHMTWSGRTQILYPVVLHLKPLILNGRSRVFTPLLIHSEETSDYFNKTAINKHKYVLLGGFFNLQHLFFTRIIACWPRFPKLFKWHRFQHWVFIIRCYTKRYSFETLARILEFCNCLSYAYFIMRSTASTTHIVVKVNMHV